MAKFSVCIPTYNMGFFIQDAIGDILGQTFGDFELVISDNHSEDETEAVVKSFSDKRIKYFKNENNVGYAGNLELCRERATGDILYLLSARSRISRLALEKIYNAFMLSPDIGAVTRAYYWFGKDISQPVRAKEPLDREKDRIISIDDDIKTIIAVFKTLDNPAGLAFRKSCMEVSFSKDKFVEFAYPFAAIFKKHKIVYLKDYTMACPAFTVSGSQDPSVYEKSPMQDWVDLFNNVFYEERFQELRKRCIADFVAVNYIGLVQIRNYASRYSHLLREIGLLIKLRPRNLINLKFWFFSLGTMIMPRKVLIALVRIYKEKVNSRRLSHVRLA